MRICPSSKLNQKITAASILMLDSITEIETIIEDYGDQFEIKTPFTGEFIVNMNSIPWDADREVCWENVNPSILLDFCVGGKIQDVIVNETSWNLYEGRRIIGDVTIKFSKDNHIYNMVFDSNVSYMMQAVENDDGFVIHCPVKKLLKSMYKMK